MLNSVYKKFDWQIIVFVLILVGFGLFSLYNFSLTRGNFANFEKQLIFLGIGFILMILFSFLDFRAFKHNSYLILALYFLSLTLLAGLFFFAPVIRGTRSWYRIGTVSFDPIFIANIVLIILLAKYFSQRHVEMYQTRHIFISGLYVLAPSVLIFFQPNLGSALVFPIIWLGILVVSGIKVRHFSILMIIFLLFSALAWNFLLKDYQRARIIAFAAPREDPLGAGWSQRQARIAIGSGGLFGQKVDYETQVRYGFLPEPHTDFIFAAIAEKTGLLGIGILLLTFSLFLWRIIRTALLTKDNFPRLFAVGLAIFFGLQIFINIGMNLGLLPVVGISLPFVSYGGSGLIMSFVGLGILQSIFHRADKPC